ncbi:MAG TPA: (d)CMP kinase [Candidatus Omnitrophica bacterium]|nr:(d)CMP kinase [Candidatus Omnitrophota bacterium]
MIITIDGPGGCGKTTVAKILAQKLRISYLDTGATYRALTLKVLKLRLDLNDEERIKEVAQSLNLKIEKDKIYLDSKEVSAEIRTPTIDKNISLVVSHPKVREEMVRLQRKIVEGNDFVVEGRDIATVVFPNAEFKFYLDADFSVRCQRRYNELREKKINVDFEEVKRDLEKRDRADKERKVGALVKSKDAIYIDTTHLSIEEVVNKILSYIKK